MAKRHLRFRYEYEQEPISELSFHLARLDRRIRKFDFTFKFTVIHFELVGSGSTRAEAFLLSTNATDQHAVTVGQIKELKVLSFDAGQLDLEIVVLLVFDQVDARLPKAMVVRPSATASEFGGESLEVASQVPKPDFRVTAGHELIVPLKNPLPYPVRRGSEASRRAAMPGGSAG